jgi:4-hydroxy-tetrahydrodipicolinate synthase
MAMRKGAHWHSDEKPWNEILAFFNGVKAVGDDVPWVLQDDLLALSVVMTRAVLARIITNYESCLMLKL